MGWEMEPASIGVNVMSDTDLRPEDEWEVQAGVDAFLLTARIKKHPKMLKAVKEGLKGRKKAVDGAEDIAKK